MFLDTETPPIPRVVRTSIKTQAYQLKLEKCLRKVLTDQVYTCVARNMQEQLVKR